MLEWCAPSRESSLFLGITFKTSSGVFVVTLSSMGRCAVSVDV